MSTIPIFFGFTIFMVITSCSSKIGSEKFFFGKWAIIQADVKTGDNEVTPNHSELGTIFFDKRGFKAEGTYGIDASGYLGYLERGVENGRWEFNSKYQQMKLNDALWSVEKKNDDLIELKAVIQRRIGGGAEEYHCLLTKQ